MKGDINLRINKKLGLGLALVIGMYAYADYVSIVHAENAGGFNVTNSNTTEEIENAVDSAIQNIMPVGSVVFRIDNTNPSSLYGGTWILIDEDASIRFGDGNNQTGIAIGNNNPDVPLKEHDHSINHDHPSTTSSSDTHSHTYYIGQNGSGSIERVGWNITGSLNGYQASNQLSSDTHNHTTDIPNYTGNSGLEGDEDNSLDVRGRYITLNVWKRTN